MFGKQLLRFALVPAALLGLGLLPGTSRANVTFTMDPVQTTTNAGDFKQVNDTTINALNLNQNQQLGQNTPILQIVTDTASMIQSPGGGGQSFIKAVDAPFGNVVITPINPPLAGFTTLELNPFTEPGPGPNEGTFYLLATDNEGTVFDSRVVTGGLFTFDENGQNRFAAVAVDGQFITRLEMVIEPPNADILKQFRLNYVLAPTTQAVPEPSTMALALSGLVGFGFAGLRRLRRREAASA